ncbi:hypothetical protein Mgra_00003470, partial [Meloidogyne graminicola]
MQNIIISVMNFIVVEVNVHLIQNQLQQYLNIHIDQQNSPLFKTYVLERFEQIKKNKVDNLIKFNTFINTL